MGGSTTLPFIVLHDKNMNFHLNLNVSHVRTELTRSPVRKHGHLTRQNVCVTAVVVAVAHSPFFPFRGRAIMRFVTTETPRRKKRGSISGGARSLARTEEEGPKAAGWQGIRNKYLG